MVSKDLTEVARARVDSTTKARLQRVVRHARMSEGRAIRLALASWLDENDTTHNSEARR